MKLLIPLLSALLLAGCTANTARQITPLPTASPLLARAGEPAFETADKWSFTQAVFRYPAGEGFHQIPVGDYLLDRIVAHAGEVHGLRLVRFESTGRTAFGVMTKHLTTLDVEVTATVAGTIRRARFAVEDRHLGPLYSGDFSAVPFAGSSLSSDSMFHEQVVPLIEEAAREIAAGLRE